MKSILLTAALIATTPAIAHDAWSTGEEVPAWVKADCCGKADAHHIKFSSIHVTNGGYKIDGLNIVIPFSRALPSQDGEAWGFWSAYSEPTTLVYCFFYPNSGS